MSHTAWLEQAESDLSAARVLSDSKHHSQAVWLAAQAVEKAHKAILVALGLRYNEKHFKHLGHNTAEIAQLLPEILHKPTDPQIASKVTALESRASVCRYPAPQNSNTPSNLVKLVAPSSSINSSKQDVEDATALVEWCRNRIDRAIRATIAMEP